jgi:RsiW-degrading membrane proteinase PrsW (M82 family)
LFSVFPVLFIEIFLDKLFPTDKINDFLILYRNVFISVGLVEEGAKWIVTKVFGFHSREFDEIYDIIVYSVFASLGFACIENILYVFQNGLGNAIMRAILSVPGHMCFAVIMGYYFARAKLAHINNNQPLYKKNLSLSIVMPCIMHTTYDALLMWGGGSTFILFLAFDVFMVVYCFGTVNRMSKIQRTLTNNVNSGVVTTNSSGYVQYNNPTPVQNVQTAQPTQSVQPAVNAPVAGYCPICGTPERGDRFCGSCGYKLR